jgi:thiol-disulfide isomerase/thioredoxin
MKRAILVILLLSSSGCFSQTAREILQQAYVKCSQIREGRYRMEIATKYPMSKDTARSASDCRFGALPGDTLFGFRFRTRNTENNGDSSGYAFDGERFAWYSAGGKNVKYLAVRDRSGEIASLAHNYHFFQPFTQVNGSAVDISDCNEDCVLHYPGEERIGSWLCRHVRITDLSLAESGIPRAVTDVWINMADSVPVRYTVSYDVVVNSDTLTQLEDFTLTEYAFGTFDIGLKNLQDFVPRGYELSEFRPEQREQLLPAASFAPKFKARSISGKKIDPARSGAKLVLLDFFYLSCYPCLKSAPYLDSLYEKFGGKGLLVLGIDNVDTKQQLLEGPAGHSSARYPVIADSCGITEKFLVQSYPTFYLIDQTGRIVYTAQGFSQEVFRQLNEIIALQLEN